MNRVIHFEIPAGNPQRAAAFYKAAFDWEFTKWDGPVDYWTVTTGPDGDPGINGGLVTRGDPPRGTVNTVGVDSVDDAIAHVEAAGGKVVQPKGPVPGTGWLAYCTDSEGNVFGLFEEDASATM